MKYKFTDVTIEYAGRTLHRIECVEAFSNIKVGEKGGYIEKESNLSHYGNAWVGDNAQVYGKAQVCNNAQVCGDALVYGDAWVYGDAQVYGDADYIVFKNNWSSGRYFTWTRSNDMWKVGCFYGTGEELIKKAYADSENSGKHYEAYVKFVEQLKELK